MPPRLIEEVMVGSEAKTIILSSAAPKPRMQGADSLVQEVQLLRMGRGASVELIG